MKRFVLLLMACMTMACGFAQNRSRAEVVKEMREVTDSLTDEQKDVLFMLTEEMMLTGVDSIMNTGMFLKALDMIDSIQVYWKSFTGREPSPRMYVSKVNILMHLEEWVELVKTTEECLSVHKEDITDRIAAFMYRNQGCAYTELKEYQKAIRSFEEGAYYHTKMEETGNQGDMLCCMAKCYMELGKYTMASSFYEKGFNKFLEYFGTTRLALLRNNFSVRDSYKNAVLGVFAAHLFSMAVYEQDYGSKYDSKDYLLMSAHCGNPSARSEYQRIYGR